MTKKETRAQPVCISLIILKERDILVDLKYNRGMHWISPVCFRLSETEIVEATRELTKAQTIRLECG